MSDTEVIYKDGSTSTFSDHGALHKRGLAITRMRLITASSALVIYLQSEGRMQLTRNGAQLAVKNVIEPITGKTYKRSMKGKEEALADCRDLINAIDNNTVVWVEE